MIPMSDTYRTNVLTYINLSVGYSQIRSKVFSLV